MSILKNIVDIAKRFNNEEDGVALSEYLVLLGLLIGGVIIAVLAFGDNLAVAWNAWADWIGLLADEVPSTLS